MSFWILYFYLSRERFSSIELWEMPSQLYIDVYEMFQVFNISVTLLMRINQRPNTPLIKSFFVCSQFWKPKHMSAWFLYFSFTAFTRSTEPLLNTWRFICQGLHHHRQSKLCSLASLEIICLVYSLLRLSYFNLITWILYLCINSLFLFLLLWVWSVIRLGNFHWMKSRKSWMLLVYQQKLWSSYCKFFQ